MAATTGTVVGYVVVVSPWDTNAEDRRELSTLEDVDELIRRTDTEPVVVTLFTRICDESGKIWLDEGYSPSRPPGSVLYRLDCADCGKPSWWTRSPTDRCRRFRCGCTESDDYPISDSESFEDEGD